MSRGFCAEERTQLLALQGVGPTVVARLEQVGFSSLAQLADEEAVVVTKQISQLIGSTCWHNSPLARSAIQAVIDLARTQKQGHARRCSHRHAVPSATNGLRGSA